MVPTVAVDLLAHVRDRGGDLSSLRALVLGGSTPSLRLVAEIEELGVPVFQGWGMTELSPSGCPHERWQERPLALVVLRPGAAAGDLRARLAARVPPWWLPDEVRVVDALPRTSVGKTDIRLIRPSYVP